MQDYLGNDMTPCNSESLLVMNQYILKDLNYENQDYDQLKDALHKDSQSPMLNILFAHMNILMEAENSRETVNNLLSTLTNFNPREELWKEALRALVNHGMCAAIPIIHRIVQQYPKDYLAVRYGISLGLLSGEKSSMLLIVESLKQDNSYLESPECCSFISFAYVENGDLSQAEIFAKRALQLNPHNAWAQHNLCHAYAGNNQFELGKRVLENRSDDWKGDFIYTHNFWHLAAFHIFLKEYSEAEQLFATHIIGKNWWVPINMINILAMLLYLDHSRRNLQQFFTEKFRETIQDKRMQGNTPILDAMIVWALAKVGEQDKAAKLKDSLNGVAKSAAEALLHYASNNLVEAQRIVNENYNEMHFLGGSIEQIQVITDCLSITRGSIFNFLE
ncbi:unnamed protein product [Blepharisma stoltei]|uniref:Tetratricopeptide repeat protein 38 n=1 Tax=Blepharisma stoltei TaxID=1481888 RepID=A0AAU9IZK1_9CILI|nr:unnamed protein product [Blepharisma stoltei]